jgi:hypothetical protein
LGKEHPDTLETVGDLAAVLRDQCRYEAEEMNGWALEGHKKVMGEYHPSKLTSMTSIALVLRC